MNTMLNENIREEIMDGTKQAKPFLKWAGGKTQLLKEISQLYKFNSKTKRYVEPFVGGGAVLFDVLNKFDVFLEEVFVSDINVDLINCYAAVKNHVDELVDLLKLYQREYLPLSQKERTDYYNKKRNRFNQIKLRYSRQEKNNCIIYRVNNNFSKYHVELAALLIFLNKTCFNGLYRESSDGKFNTPVGRYKNPTICDEKNLRLCSKKLRKCFICSCDFEKALSFANDTCFVYLDPPYRPLTDTSFTSYTSVPFDDDEQVRLSECIHNLADRKGHFVLSNSDPHNTNKDDNFFDDLYSEYNIKRVKASRVINSDSSKREKVSELLIYNK